MAYKGIGEYGLIGNSHTAALVSNDGSIDWCCLPRFDSPSAFAAILDDEKGGRFHIRSQTPFQSLQAYLTDTNILKTSFQTDTGAATIIDFMPCYRTSGHKLTNFNEIHRLVECTAGQMPLEVVFDPRLDYARDNAPIETYKNGVTVRGRSDRLALSSTIPFTSDGDKAIGSFILNQGESAQFILRYGTDQPKSPGIYHSRQKLERTTAYWKEKAEGCVFSGPLREVMVRSYLTLHLMVYAPTGAIIAAPTTSLPEEIGGERNWDYRYAWLRDASLTLNALFYLGHIEEALGFFNWLVTLCAKCGAKAQILYDIDYEHPVQEQILDHLKGYRNSPPVRIGNAAYAQLQLDVFGEVMEAAYNYLHMGGYISRRTWESLESFIDAACENWRLPDNGIWEIRGGPYHFTHSKLMCWVAVDRGIKIAEELGFGENIKRWQDVAKDIRSDILARGWNPEKRAFTQHYDTTALDASNLLMPLYGFLPITDERISSTIDRTIEELGHNGLLRRYRTDKTDDGLSGSEGEFLWCSFWLVRNLLRMGRLEDAAALYQRLLGYSNHLGLFPEMVDSVSGEARGNFPQALTHLAVINTGLEVTRALEGETSGNGKPQ
jgi:GH15 family glucan-1,4-alpha-glucosidase